LPKLLDRVPRAHNGISLLLDGDSNPNKQTASFPANKRAAITTAAFALVEEDDSLNTFPPKEDEAFLTKKESSFHQIPLENEHHNIARVIA
jgi:hypothetical protein